MKILEARNRIGGRIWIDHSFGFPASRGASWIHGIDNNPVMALAREYSSQTLQMQISERLYFDRYYKPIPKPIIDHFNQNIMNPALKLASEKAAAQSQAISLAEALTAIIDFKQLSPMEQDLYLYKLKFFENYIGAEYDLLSARNWDEEEFCIGSHVIVADGYEKILTELSISCQIELNTVVQMIKNHSNYVEIVTNRGIFNADAIIITLPLGVLKKQAVIFDPPLSTQKLTAINQLAVWAYLISSACFSPLSFGQNRISFFNA